MLNVNEFLACITRKGMSREQVAKEIGMTPKTFSRRIKNRVFGSDEIEKLITLLDIDNPMTIFFSH